MAKGLRASSERTNRRKLRTKVFGPVETARAERLHAKLLATINSDKPAPPKNKVANETATEAKDDVEKDTSMDVDSKTSTKKAHTNQRDQKTKKQHARKPRNSITFPTSRGKGALKPFTGKSRVGKNRK